MICYGPTLLKKITPVTQTLLLVERNSLYSPFHHPVLCLLGLEVIARATRPFWSVLDVTLLLLVAKGPITVNASGSHKCRSATGSTFGTRRVTLVTNPVISHEWGNGWFAITTRMTYPWSFVTDIQIFRNDYSLVNLAQKIAQPATICIQGFLSAN